MSWAVVLLAERRMGSIMRSSLLTLVVLVCLGGPLYAQQIPENALRVSFGKGWMCNTAYIERNATCVHLSVATDSEVRQFLIRQSIAAYSGSCACPFNVDRAGRRCGGRSAYSRPGGASPTCYERDVSDAQVRRTRERYPPPGSGS